MVIVHNGDKSALILGATLVRESYKYMSMLIAESIFSLIVAISNVILIFVLVVGWRTLMRNKFYIVLANLIICTSLKAFVELGFIVPVLIRASRSTFLFIFNRIQSITHGLKVNGPMAVTRTNSRWTAISCAIVWFCAAVIPVLFYIFECQFLYKDGLNLYTTKCFGSEGLEAQRSRTEQQYLIYILIRCLIYLSYACTIVVLVVYLLILCLLKYKRMKMRISETTSRISTTELHILWQSLLVFALYAASILCIFALSFIRLDSDGDITDFDIAYVENLLNLSIAAVYPICFLVMSGDMKKYSTNNFQCEQYMFRVLIDIIFRQTYSSNVHVSSNTN
ncbi:hypothetical protein PRIPAC_77172 [Pristionchus pacificus]|uniref:G_PROTEIN_RECEP_F1_2 domain-containing protein n=1 Tax=Pristionchus pacificus TaxID=54126 RepID=A0A2A6CKK7_PRIPA|nr:hypothetical protein PRIPAC_77172 [Pristionchus pacificus]|eukprot:PDM78561.1 hypothetical protein PRIPAC_31140 [Pristionchus pacificus]